MKNKLLKLPPKIHPLIGEFINDRKTLSDLTSSLGSPINLLFPAIFSENISNFKNLLSKSGVEYEIFYAHKVNQSYSLIKTAYKEMIKIDISSEEEFRNAKKAGFETEQIEATGPKGIEFLETLVKGKAFIQIDNEWEFDQIVNLSKIYRLKTKVLIRLSGFKNSKVSRFGIPVIDAEKILIKLKKNKNFIDFVGFSFHLDSNNLQEKIYAIEECLDLYLKSYSIGLNPTAINIGGGYRQVFSEDTGYYTNYIEALKESFLKKGETMTWNENMFGFYLEKNSVKGIPVFHKFEDNTSGTDFLVRFLESKIEKFENRTIARLFRENGIKLLIEPGKSLVDHAGITLSRVEFVKKASDGSILVNLDIKRDNLIPVDQEIMLDPVIIYKGKDVKYKKGSFGVYFASNLCLERDMIYNHKTYIEKLPEPGDLVIFINTAAYQMDLSASKALMHPTPRKIAIEKTNSKFSWTEEN